MARRASLAAAMALAFCATTAVLAQQPPAQPPTDGLPDGPGKDVVVRVCTSCHEASQFTQKRRTSEGWDDVIGKMIDQGAELTGPEQEAVHAYLLKNFGPPPAASPDEPKPPSPQGR